MKIGEISLGFEIVQVVGEYINNNTQHYHNHKLNIFTFETKCVRCANPGKGTRLSISAPPLTQALTFVFLFLQIKENLLTELSVQISVDAMDNKS